MAKGQRRSDADDYNPPRPRPPPRQCHPQPPPRSSPRRSLPKPVTSSPRLMRRRRSFGRSGSVGSRGSTTRTRPGSGKWWEPRRCWTRLGQQFGVHGVSASASVLTGIDPRATPRSSDQDDRVSGDLDVTLIGFRSWQNQPERDSDASVDGDQVGLFRAYGRTGTTYGKQIATSNWSRCPRHCSRDCR